MRSIWFGPPFLLLSSKETHDCSISRYQDDDVPPSLTSRVPSLTDETPSGSSDGDESEDWREKEEEAE